MTWEDELRRQIRSKDTTEPRTHIRVGGESAYEIKVRSFRVQVGPHAFEFMHTIVNCVNRDPVAGVGRGMLKITRTDAEILEPGNLLAYFTFELTDRPWNHFPSPSPSGEWVELRDSVGALLYPEVDFSVIPSARYESQL